MELDDSPNFFIKPRQSMFGILNFMKMCYATYHFFYGKLYETFLP